MPPRRDNPYGAFNFIVEIGGNAQAGFAEVAGLGLEVVETDYRSGSDPELSVRKIPGLAKHPNVTLKRGFAGDPTLFNWIRSIQLGKPDKRDVVITLLDEARQPVAKWTLHRAWPVKWGGPSFNAKSNDTAMESLELAYDDLTQDGQP